MMMTTMMIPDPSEHSSDPSHLNLGRIHSLLSQVNKFLGQVKFLGLKCQIAF